MSKLEGAVIIYDTLGTVITEDNMVRPKLVESITKFKAEGARFFLTSSFTSQEVERYAKLLGISSLIDGALGVSLDRNKSYSSIVERLDMTEESAKHKLLVSGDRFPGDAGTDGYGNVFVYDSYGFKRDSMVMNDLVNRLFDNGDKSFVTGFNRLADSTTPHLATDGSRLIFMREKLPGSIDFASPTIYIK